MFNFLLLSHNRDTIKILRSSLGPPARKQLTGEELAKLYVLFSHWRNALETEGKIEIFRAPFKVKNQGEVNTLRALLNKIDFSTTQFRLNVVATIEDFKNQLNIGQRND